MELSAGRWCSAWVVVAALVAPAAQAGEPEAQPPLAYAGFAFAGNFSARKALYPRTATISEEAGGTYIDGLLRQRLEKKPELLKRLSMDLVDNDKYIHSVALAFSHESVETQRIDGQHWLVAVLQAQVLAFNRKSASVVASYPLRYRVASVLAAAPTEADAVELVRSAFTNPNPRDNVLDLLLERLERVRIKESTSKRVQVTGVKILPEAQRVLDQAGQDPGALANQVANFLESSITEKAGIALVPNSVGEAIGAKMALRFANGELNLTLPQPDYGIQFTIREFVSKRLEKPDVVQDIYRVKAGVLLQLVGDRDILDENIYDTHITTMPVRSGVTLDSWPQYTKTLQSLIDTLGKQLVQTDDKWLAEHASRNMDARAQFQNANLVLGGLK